MATKTFKIGEYCVGGILKLETKGNVVTVKNLDFYSKDVLGWGKFDMDNRDSDRELPNYLHDLTTSYYTDKVMDWVKSKIKIDRQLFY